MSDFILIIFVILITFAGGIIRLCIFGHYSLKEALLYTSIIDITLGLVVLYYKLIDKDIPDNAFIIVIIFLAIIYIAIEIVKSKRKTPVGENTNDKEES